MKQFVMVGLATALMSTTALAGGGAIHTGGDKGAYFTTFCPPLPDALSVKDFPNYKCTPSGGTLDNISKVLAKPSDIGFVQLDVYAREVAAKPELKDKLVVVRSDIACEGLWMITNKPEIASFADVLGSRRSLFVLPPDVSGSAASFKYIQSLDPDGLGRAKNVKNVADAGSVIETVAASKDKAIGFFVQFADPQNANIKKMQEKGVTVVPVISREVSNAKVDGQDLYSIQSYNLTEGGWIASAKEATTACTPVAVITGNPASLSGRDAVDDQKEMIAALRSVPSEKLLPKEGRLAALMKNVRKVSGSALNDMIALADKANQAAKAAMKD
jgi:hypothetical protein